MTSPAPPPSAAKPSAPPARPEPGEPLLHEAEALIDRGDTAGATALIERVLAQRPNDPLANCLLAQIAIAIDEPKQALALLARAEAHARARIRARIRCLRAEILRRQRRLAEALDLFNGVLAQHRTGGAEDRVAVAALIGSAQIHQEAGRPEAAHDCLARAAAIAPENLALLRAIGHFQHQRGDYLGATESFRKLLSLGSANPPVFNDLAGALKELGRLGEAEQSLRLALRLDPAYKIALRNLGILLYDAKRSAEAAEIMAELCRLDPDDAFARHSLAALTGADGPERASDQYVRTFFDGFAETFDKKLVERLHYAAPELIAERLAAALPPPDGRLAILDAGCGTGLCAPHLKPYAARLAGVDLSPAMIRKARARELYDELVEGEIGAFLARHKGGFDVIVAADVFVYFGALREVFAGAAAALRPNGLFAFTVERDAAGGATPGYKLGLHGRYAHAEAYLRELCRDAGFAILAFDTVVLRHEQDAPVAGFALVLRAAPEDGATG
jgi:predicted TPR repeat methyltransferase